MRTGTVKAQSGPRTSRCGGGESRSGAKICGSQERPGSSPGHPMNAPLGRAGYLVAGLALVAVKLTVDRIVTYAVFGRTWTPSVYWIPIGHGARPDALGGADRTYLTTLLAIALPFIAAGTWLTLRRLRSAGWSPW